MIRETTSSKSRPALTSDQWHVLHAQFCGDLPGRAHFQRTIVSEHGDRRTAVAAAREMVDALASDNEGRRRSARDQVLVRRPAYKSLKTARRVPPRRK